MPGGSRIRVTFDGSGLTDFLGRPVDLDGDGQPGGAALVDFDTLSLVAISKTAVCGRVFASQLQPVPGSTNQFVNVPLAGVTVTVDGMEESMRAVSDQFGNFRLEPVPGGPFFVHIDGRTVTNVASGIHWPDMAYYPNVGKKWESIPQQEVNIGEIYLPLIPDGTLKPLNLTNDTVLTFSAGFIAANPQFAGVSITVPPDDLYSENGARGGMVGIAPVPPTRLPGPLPPGLPILDVITIQTDGPGNFDRPVAACFPNLQGLPPGAKSALWCQPMAGWFARIPVWESSPQVGMEAGTGPRAKAAKKTPEGAQTRMKRLRALNLATRRILSIYFRVSITTPSKICTSQDVESTLPGCGNTGPGLVRTLPKEMGGTFPTTFPLNLLGATSSCTVATPALTATNCKPTEASRAMAFSARCSRTLTARTP